MNNDPVTDISHLPALSADLELVRRGRNVWQIEALSGRLLALIDCSADEVVGRTPTALFPAMVPSLTLLADEVLESGHDLFDIQLQLLADAPEFLADIQFAGLSDDYLGQRVRVQLRYQSIASQQAPAFGRLIGSSSAMREVFRKIQLYAASDAAVIITGETGAGKELVAQALHDESARRNQPFAALNCTALSEQLLESELFGHDKGAFTGAVRDHRGYFERADGGTLFLDEIGDMPLATQSKLLRVLEDGQVQRVGSELSRQVDVRFIGATNVPLEQAVAQQQFRADLYHRLAVLRIHLPPLRERLEDIPLLAEQFLQQFSQRYQKPARRLTAEAIRLLQAYLWPGNVRELRNVIERIVVENETEAIGARAFAEWIQERRQFAGTLAAEAQPQTLPVAIPYYHSSAAQRSSRSGGRRIELSEEDIRRAYRAADGNLSAAARALGVHRATLYRRLRTLGLVPNDL